MKEDLTPLTPEVSGGHHVLLATRTLRIGPNDYARSDADWGGRQCRGPNSSRGLQRMQKIQAQMLQGTTDV